VKMAYPEAERDDVQFCVNIETVTGANNFDAMLDLADVDELDGIVLGRVDMCGSLGLTREDINQPQLHEIAVDLFAKAKAHGLECAIGGGVGKEALDFMRQIPAGLLDRYETRKVVFASPAALDDNAEAGILKAVGFELMWLKNKRDFYGAIFEEDHARIDMLQSRYDHLIEQAGGRYT
jgi:4-hydroxy-2-oxoheptanedioate aldolase